MAKAGGIPDPAPAICASSDAGIGAARCSAAASAAPGDWESARPPANKATWKNAADHTDPRRLNPALCKPFSILALGSVVAIRYTSLRAVGPVVLMAAVTSP